MDNIEINELRKTKILQLIISTNQLARFFKQKLLIALYIDRTKYEKQDFLFKQKKGAYGTRQERKRLINMTVL